MGSGSPSSPASVAAAVLDLARSRPATLGSGRLVCIDGPAGSGKTSLAAATGVPVVHMDDLYDGWRGLPQVGAQLDTLLGPLARGEPGHYRRYDWIAATYAETVTVAPGPLLILEGVGSGALRFADLVTVLVWVDAPADLRLSRGLERDGEAVREEWVRWMREEQDTLTRDRTRERADVVVDGTGGEAPRVRG